MLFPPEPVSSLDEHSVAAAAAAAAAGGTLSLLLLLHQLRRFSVTFCTTLVRYISKRLLVSIGKMSISLPISKNSKSVVRRDGRGSGCKR